MRKFTFLGTGTSTGVPSLGCQCAVCTSDDARNRRYRSSALLQLPGGNLAIDTPPEFRLSLLRERIGLVHAVLYTHYHADHLFGLDDLRQFPHQLGGPLPVRCTEEVLQVIRRAFPYAFPDDPARSKGMFVPQLAFEQFASGVPFELLGEAITPIRLEHAHFEVHGFRLADLAYCTDVNRIPDESMDQLRGLDVLVLDALRERPHPAHFTLEQALEVIAVLEPKQAYLTHISHELDHAATSERLPANVAIAYDGLSFPF